ncbi:unnamed protein product [Microthlaspi erraticum]|uniref:Uncharacterized protein n=1 Tax=Microthlaspi erraticum TaxID=1685480 RepID=A0A6D2K812_9BRAS|nr:unnamed protein product [Microthlaspi erraticum]
MGKSSSSSKKIKPSKDSSKLRSVKKKKTKRSKSKKIRRIRDYSDESESSGSDSSLYSTSSEDDYRRKKRRSKVSKKKRYSSSESDDDTRLLKKKKRSKRKDEHLGTKKKKKKVSSRKRRRRDSSSSSDNESDDGSESDGNRRIRDRERLDKVKAESEEEVEDEVMTTEKSNPRRLKSIVVVSYRYDNDERKEDMVDDHDDESYEDQIVNDDDESGRKAFGYDEFEEDDYNNSETSKSSYPENSLKDDDLEAMLKQRALENLKRFRGIARKEASPVSEGEALQTESEQIEKSQDHGLMEQKLSIAVESKDLETSQKIVDVNESGTGLANLASQQSGDAAKVKASSGLSSCTTKRKLIRPVLGQERLNLASRKEDAEAESINGSTLDKNVPESSLTMARKNGGDNIERTEASSALSAQSSSSADTETLDETKGGSQPEQKTDDETKDESQYEKKTMTVMRGGEMVQVSYKVYIPKKSSSFGRRQLIKR